jgi:hypothetical protein
MTSRIPQTRIELEKQLLEQISFIKNSASGYDRGNESEAKRLATPIRILVYDSRTSRSLLGLLGMKGIGFYDTAHEINENNLLTEWCIVTMRIGSGGTGFIAPLDDSPRGEGVPVTFEKWWNKPIFRDKDRNILTRKDIVLSIANQDGGAHVDPELEAKYVKLSRYNSLGWMASTPLGEIPLPGPHLPALRQIAHEVLKSLEHRVPPIHPVPSTRTLVGSHKKIGRNDPCPCGSGAKYKKCCGKPV